MLEVPSCLVMCRKNRKHGAKKTRKKTRKRQCGKGSAEAWLRKAGSYVIPGLASDSYAKYGWNAKRKNFARGKSAGKLAGELLMSAAKGPANFAFTLLKNAPEIGARLHTNYDMPLGDPRKLDPRPKPIADLFGGGFAIGSNFTHLSKLWKRKKKR